MIRLNVEHESNSHFARPNRGVFSVCSLTDACFPDCAGVARAALPHEDRKSRVQRLWLIRASFGMFCLKLHPCLVMINSPGAALVSPLVFMLLSSSPRGCWFPIACCNSQQEPRRVLTPHDYILPRGWIVAFSNKLKRDYYFDTVSKMSQWTPPEGSIPR